MATAEQDLADIVSRLRRALRRAARAAHTAQGQGQGQRQGQRQGLGQGHGTALSVAQLELLSCVAENPGIRPTQLARVLRLAPSSVATLLNALQATGHITRSGGADRRTATLALSGAGQAAVTRWQRLNDQIIGAALSSLPARSQSALEHAAPALRELTAAIDTAAGRE